VKIETTPAVIAKIRLYAEAFDKRPPPILAHFPGGADPVFPFAADSDRGLGILLFAAALHHPGGEAAVARLLAGLYRAHGNDIFKLNRLPFEPLRDQVNALAAEGRGMNEEARDRIPGILRSACDFFYRVGALGPWLASASDWEIRAGELCNEIYWMGAHSRARTKARLFFWLACQVPGFGARHSQAAAFEWPISDGHMRFWIDILKPGRTAGGRTPEERVTAFAAFARTVFPGAPWRLFQPLDNFLRRDGAGGYVCRNVQGGCRPCPLSALCPAAANFIPHESS
jgi:hypothetical protein